MSEVLKNTLVINVDNKDNESSTLTHNFDENASIVIKEDNKGNASASLTLKF